MKKTLSFWLIILFQIALLFTIIIRYEYVLNTGQEIFMKIRPVDPRDYFRGDYVTLNYDLRTYKLDINDTRFTEWEKVYVEFNSDENNFVESIKNISTEKPETWTYIYSEVQNIYWWKAEYKISHIDKDTWENVELSYTGYVYDNIKEWDNITFWYRDDWTIYNIGKIDDKNMVNERIIDETYNTWAILYASWYRDMILDFWADRFFVKEGTGHDIEDEFREHRDDSYVSWKIKNWKNVIDYLLVWWKKIK